MIEWIILGLVGLAGAGAREKQRSPFTSTSSNGYAKRTEEDARSESEYQELLRAWRARWEPEVDRSRWIPAGTSMRILAKHPAPEAPRRTSGSYVPYVKPKHAEELDAEFSEHNRTFLQAQKERLKDFFDTIEAQPLVDEQITACVCMDDNLMVAAAAGSGKTSTMVAKAGYALREGLAQGDEILVLSFNNDAAKELEDRIRARLRDMDGAAAITAKTFHSFGLSVIGQATGRKPNTARWLPDGEIDTIAQIVEDLSRDPNFRDDWNLFRTVFGRPAPGAQADDVEGVKPIHRTANGEYVRSGQERQIADWLFYHSVPYEYEARYQHPVYDDAHGQYQPDFFYREIGVYHEHFAIGADGRSPFGQKYLDGVEWKRALHKRHDTRLFETKSSEFANGTALSRLRKMLEEHGVAIEFDPDRVGRGTKPIPFKQLATKIRTFQKHVKSNHLSAAQLDTMARAHAAKGDAARIELFMRLFIRISDEWERKLQETDSIDFEDMLGQAAEHIEAGTYKSPYRLILVDEFQDSSRSRVRMLKALRSNAAGPVHVCAVGDDWQSINRFAGSDLVVMTDFAQAFDHASRLMLTTTFRCPPAICTASADFIQANPAQIPKTVTTTNTFDGQAMVAFAFHGRDVAMEHLGRRLRLLADRISSGELPVPSGRRTKVMLLGRYKREQPAQFAEWRRMVRGDIDLSFSTVHAAKGLEADFVVMLGMVEDVMGFPSQIEDDPILQIPMPNPDPFPMAEERRLFYVALTRARRQVWIYTDPSRPSRFVLELEKQGAVVIRDPNKAPVVAQPEPGGASSKQTVAGNNGRQAAPAFEPVTIDDLPY